MFGIVLGGSNNIFSVECEDSIIRQCTIKGKKLEASKGYYNPLAPGDEVEIETPVKLDRIGRGWMGDLFVHMRGISIKDVDKRTDEEHIVRDVLCIRCYLNGEQGEAATWTYTFLKD